MDNKKANAILITLVVILAIILITVLWAIGSYNSLIKVDTEVENSWAKVQTAYQRRFDLIPNLVNTVKGAVKFEQETQTEIAALRSGINNAKTPQELDNIGSKMNGLISGIMVSVEAYPDLKATQNFLALQDELAGTENRIKWERDNYNNAVKDYKILVRRFPTNIIAGMVGMDSNKYDMFEAIEGSNKPVEVNFE